MEIVNETPFVVTPMPWEDLHGQPKLTIILKATFTIKEDTAVVAQRQLPILTGDEHYDDNPLASVRYESDMVPFKPRADVVVVGRAQSPNRVRVTELGVRLRVGALQKALYVFGDRKWSFRTKLALAPTISRPEPFVTMDLIYERAFGGIDAASAQYCKQNPIGRGFIGSKTVESIHEKPLPNIEDPNDRIASWDSHPNPAGFGFYGRGWMPRVVHAGTYDERYRKERAPALPEDFSYELFNGAHPDLQVKGYLRGDEEVELINMSREPHLSFQLPGIRPRITVTQWKAGAARPLTVTQSVKAVLDTIVFIPGERTFYEVFRGVCPLDEQGPLGIAQIKIAM